MRRRRLKSARSGEEGVVVMLVAIFLLFVVGAMAALAIDLVTIYTARSEAQQAADAAALAGARVLANSGMTSADPTDAAIESNAEALANIVVAQVAAQNKIAGGAPTVSPPIYNTTDPDFHLNPHITVQVSRTDLPTYFSRIWGATAAAVKASATAEAYNPSGLNSSPGTAPPVAPTCVKPWLLPNLDPTPGGTQIFDTATGAIKNYGMLGWNAPKSPPSTIPGLTSVCPTGDCSGSPIPGPTKWKFYPEDQIDFPTPPTQRTCTAIPTPTPYQQNIAGCAPTPIACNQIVHIDVANVPGRATQTADAVNCLTRAMTTLGDGDYVDPLPVPSTAPFTFVGGTQNPVPNAPGKQLVVSDSIVTVPVIDTTLTTAANPTGPVVGFVQIFLNADGGPTSNVDPTAPIQTKIINLVGCGSNAGTGQAVLGNGNSPVAVRLITPGP